MRSYITILTGDNRRPRTRRVITAYVLDKSFKNCTRAMTLSQFPDRIDATAAGIAPKAISAHRIRCEVKFLFSRGKSPDRLKPFIHVTRLLCTSHTRTQYMCKRSHARTSYMFVFSFHPRIHTHTRTRAFTPDSLCT